MIGIDLSQFALDPFGSGVQRVLQQLAKHWPSEVPAEFLLPTSEGFAVLHPVASFELLSSTFESRPADHEAPELIAGQIKSLMFDEIASTKVADRYSSWLVPEMTYDSKILRRIRAMQDLMPVTMIGYDALPMSHPENYHFTPGTYGNVSEYLRILRDAERLVCISEFTREQMFGVLRRERSKLTEVAHPGGDHVAVATATAPTGRPNFLRVGTMEARKHPVEIVTSFMAAVDKGLEANLVFIGSPSRVDVAINGAVMRAVDSGYPVRWVRDATDDQVADFMGQATAFLSFGIEGYGIPVLEAIRRGVPVIFDGIQPAGEIMEGRGARRLSLNASIEAWRDAATVSQSIRHQIEPDLVPSWEDFTASVAALCR